MLCATRFMEPERVVNEEYRPLMLQALEVNGERSRCPSRGKSEVLYSLDQPRRRFKLQAILRDTSADLEQIPQLLARFRTMLSLRAHAKLPAFEEAVRKNLNSREALSMVPGRDTQNG